MGDKQNDVVIENPNNNRENMKINTHTMYVKIHGTGLSDHQEACFVPTLCQLI